MAVRRPVKAPAAKAAAHKPAPAKTAEVRPAPVKAAVAAPVEDVPVAKPIEAKPVEAKPVAKAVEPKPAVASAEPKSVAIKSVAIKPVEAKPVEAKPVEAKHVAAKPVETKPVAAKAAEAPVKAAAAVDMAGVQDNLRKAASKTLEQGRAAFERMKEASDEATHTIEASLAASSKGAAELASKALEVAKINANATFDHLKALAGAKTLADAVSMHGQFIRAQSEAAVAQAKEFAELAKKAATDAAAPIQAQIKKSQAK